MLDYDVVCNSRDDYTNGPHAHADDMLFVPLDGFFSIAADATHPTKIIAHGTVWFVPGRCTHHVAATPAQRHLCYYVDMPTLVADGRRLDGQAVTQPCHWPISTLLGDLLRLRRHVSDDRAAPAGLSASMIDQLILREAGRLAASTPCPQRDESAWVVEQLKRFIGDHLDRDLNCLTLAHQVGVSERTLARWFLLREGQSIGQYIQRTRLQEALRLLRSSTLPIADIQAAVGFSSAAYFAFAIRKAFGHPPTALRRSTSGVAEN